MADPIPRMIPAILHASLQWLRQNSEHDFELPKDTHNSPSGVSYKVSLVSIWRENNAVIIGPYDMMKGGVGSYVMGNYIIILKQ